MKTLTQRINAYSQLKEALSDLDRIATEYENRIEPFREELKSKGIKVSITKEWLLSEHFSPGINGFIGATYSDSNKYIHLDEMFIGTRKVLKTRHAKLPIEAQEFHDKLEWCIKFLETDTIKLLDPKVYYSGLEGYRGFISILKKFLARIDNILNLESFINSSGAADNTIDEWEDLLERGKFEELFPKMKSFFKESGDLDGYRQVILLLQRYNYNKSSKDRISHEEFNRERNKITEAIIELIFGNKEP